MSATSQFVKASRLYTLPVMVLPVLIGAVGAYSWQHQFDIMRFALTVIGAAALHLFSNMINDLWDYRNEVDVEEDKTADSIATNSQFLTQGIWSERKYAIITWSLLALSVSCGIALTVLSGYMVMVYGIGGALIAYYYVAPPLRFGYRGKGYSEIAIVISFGVLPVLGSYYAQTSAFDLRALLVSLPIGLLTTLILFNHHFLHFRADAAAGKRTLVVVFGEQRALRFSKGLLVLALIALVAAVLGQALPVYALVGLLAVWPLIRVYRGLGTTNPAAAYLPLMAGSLQASVLCGVILAACLWIASIW
jgi:1,4-dihydroxy-2-naphthoate octaprenyltransferase